MKYIADCLIVNDSCPILRRGSSQTFVKSIHVQLSYKRRNVCMLEVLAVACERGSMNANIQTYERTFEKSLEGDIMKLSAELDHDMRCCML